MSDTTVRGGKRERQEAILQLIATRPIHTQDELVEALRELRMEATQATVSRDVRELGLHRVHDDAGARWVAAPDAVERLDRAVPLARAAREYLRSVEFVEHLGVLRTGPGCAPLVAAALDAARIDDLAGTVAGDDTVLVVARGRVAARRLENLLNEMRGVSR